MAFLVSVAAHEAFHATVDLLRGGEGINVRLTGCGERWWAPGTGDALICQSSSLPSQGAHGEVAAYMVQGFSFIVAVRKW